MNIPIRKTINKVKSKVSQVFGSNKSVYTRKGIDTSKNYKAPPPSSPVSKAGDSGIFGDKKTMDTIPNVNAYRNNPKYRKTSDGYMKK